ncbi:amidohydrolase family protein [Streptomyces sp. NBC_00448]|uniref:amidohydrolase family protein n=1 Tax=Streptomyces sp. NBC_00448 TaxID=2903652 RepID=UPI002E20AB6B
MLVIDTRTHVISTDGERYPIDPVGGRRSDWSREHPVDLDGLLRALDNAGIDRAVVVLASTVCGHDNRYPADSVAARPDRLVGVHSLDAMAPDAVARIAYGQSRGLAGFRLFTTGTTLPGQAGWLGHPDTFPAWEHAEAQHMPICPQMTVEGIPAPRRARERFPRTRVLLDHRARPDLSDGRPYRRSGALFELAEFPGVHRKPTHRAIGAARQGTSTVPDFLAALLSAYGSARLMWGCKVPSVEGELADLLGQARASLASLPAADAEAVFGGTAERFSWGARARTKENGDA